jgi:hypothetical protein
VLPPDRTELEKHASDVRVAYLFEEDAYAPTLQGMVAQSKRSDFKL